MSLLTVAVAANESTTKLIDDLEGGILKAQERVLREVSRAWLRNIREGFEKETDPYGIPWVELSPFTVELKSSQGYPDPSRILFATGELSQSFTSFIDTNSFLIASLAQEKADKMASGKAQAPLAPFSLVPERVMVPDASRLPAQWQEQLDTALNNAFGALQL